MLPEVLPAPTPTSTTNARARTAAHMRKMMVTAMAAAGCAREASPSTVTIPTASNAPTTGQTGSLPPLHSATAGASAKPPDDEPRSDIGYAVVDPMPAPARCMGLAAASKAKAALKADAGGAVLEVTLTLATTGAWQGTVFDTTRGSTSAWGGQLVSKTFKGSTATVTVKPTIPASSQSTHLIGVSFPISCAAGNGNVTVTAAMPMPIHAGATTTVTLTDY